MNTLRLELHYRGFSKLDDPEIESDPPTPPPEKPPTGGRN